MEAIVIVENDEGIKHVEIDELVNKFLSWELPDSVCSDTCVTMQGEPNRMGTNLLTATEAKQMLEYLFKR